jgi:hypothetical protein
MTNAIGTELRWAFPVSGQQKGVVSVMAESIKLDLLHVSTDGQDGIIEFLKTSLTKPVVVSAAGVQRPAFPVLEALVAGKLQWQQDQVPFQIEDADDAFRQNLTILGLSEIFEMESES